MNILEAGHSLAQAAERVDEAIAAKRQRRAQVLSRYDGLIDASDAITQSLRKGAMAEAAAFDQEIAELEAIKGGDKPEIAKAE